MAKRRTRRQKEQAKHANTISWDPEVSRDRKEKKESVATLNSNAVKPETEKNKKFSGKKVYQNTVSFNTKVKKDIFKSVFVAGFIITLEIALYFTWK